jgi:hypothetical protein
LGIKGLVVGREYKIQKQGEKGNEIGLAKQATATVLPRVANG